MKGTHIKIIINGKIEYDSVIGDGLIYQVLINRDSL
jgi:hypothetical protein